jgi:hypothetical protein
MGKRFIVEGEWSGYRSAQRRVVHREVLTHGREGFEQISALVFTDGTTLDVTVRDAKPRERVTQILGYRDALHGAKNKGLKGFVDITKT